MVVRYGMNEELGNVVYEEERRSFLGNSAELPMLQTVRKYSEETAREIDRAVRDLVDRAFRRAREILDANRNLLDESANLLLERETLAEEELRAFAAYPGGVAAGDGHGPDAAGRRYCDTAGAVGASSEGVAASTSGAHISDSPTREAAHAEPRHPLQVRGRVETALADQQPLAWRHRRQTFGRRQIDLESREIAVVDAISSASMRSPAASPARRAPRPARPCRARPPPLTRRSRWTRWLALVRREC